MGPKTVRMWKSPGGVTRPDINANGVWEMVDAAAILRSDIPARVTCAKGAGNNPVGATVSVGIKVGNLTPEDIAGASMTLPTLASTTATIPLRIYPDGRVCLTVASLPAGASIIAEVIQ